MSEDGSITHEGEEVTESEVFALKGEVIALTEAIRARDSRNRWILAGFVILMVFLAGAVAVAFDAADTAQETADDLVTERGASRAIACDSYNTDTVDRINGILIATIATSSNPERAAGLVETLLIPHRDCSKTGIDAYFDGDPATDPFIPTELPTELPAGETG